MARLPHFLPDKAPGVADADAARGLRWLRRRGRADGRELAAFWRDRLGLTRGQGYAAARILRTLPGVVYTPPPGGCRDGPGIYDAGGRP